MQILWQKLLGRTECAKWKPPAKQFLSWKIVLKCSQCFQYNVGWPSRGDWHKIDNRFPAIPYRTKLKLLVRGAGAPASSPCFPAVGQEEEMPTLWASSCAQGRSPASRGCLEAGQGCRNTAEVLSLQHCSSSCSWSLLRQPRVQPFHNLGMEPWAASWITLVPDVFNWIKKAEMLIFSNEPLCMNAAALHWIELNLVSYVFEGKATAGIRSLPLDQALTESKVSPLSLITRACTVITATLVVSRNAYLGSFSL